MDVIWLTKKASRTDSTVQDDNNRSGNDTDADDADIRPIYDEEPMAEVQLTAECNIFAIGQQHTEQPEIITEGRVAVLLKLSDSGKVMHLMLENDLRMLEGILFPPLSKHLESRSNGWECIENNNVGLSLRSNQNGGIYQGHPELEIAVLSMIGEDVYKENATRLANTGTMHNRSYALSWKPCQGDSLNLPDHRYSIYTIKRETGGLDDGVAASFQQSQIHKPHAHTHAFKVNRSTSRSLILNFPTIKEPQSQIKNSLFGKIVRLIITYVKQECNKYEHVGQEHKLIKEVKSR
ncbi:hypothetical protein Tco_0613257 [Tanacetum coccineum]